MLEPPAISEETIAGCLAAGFGLHVISLEFLPLGADQGTAIYRAVAGDAQDYFVKLRFGHFDEMAALVPRWLANQGIPEIMSPIPAKSGRPFLGTPDFTLILYPFVEGRDAYEIVLSDEQWIAFGRGVRRIHDARLPGELSGRLPREAFGAQWRDQLRGVVTQPVAIGPLDPIGAGYAAFLDERQAQVLDLIDRTDRLATALHPGSADAVLCHTDLHPGNLLVRPDGRFFIVDWDAPLLAPRERDLMYPGGGQGFPGRSADDEDALFYEGYGAVEVDVRGLAYYRLERIIEDLAVIGAQLLGSGPPALKAEADRDQGLRWAMSNFVPGGVLEIADETYRRLSRPA